MKVVAYDEKYKRDFIELNKLWISEMFTFEEQDLEVLNNIDEEIKKQITNILYNR